MLAYFIVLEPNDLLPLTEDQTRELMEPAAVCLVAPWPPVVGDKFDSTEGTWTVLTVGRTGRTGKVRLQTASFG